tara:strand:- start:13522 stop:14328 length:807 start_codon:yes stop_codon:yes gene_type:complete
MDKYIISIIIVSLNTKAEFLKTLNSIKNQKFNNYEVIVIDGDSTDGTVKEIVNNKKFITKYIIGKDKGIYDAMNKGIKLASGDWIMFLNSGDIFFNNFVLQKLNINSLKNKEVVFGDTVVDNKDIKYLVNSKMFDTKTIIMPFCHQSCLVKGDILKKNNFSLKYKYSSDFNFFFNCYLKNIKFYQTDIIISIVNSGGLSDRFRDDVLKENFQILKKNIDNKYLFMIYFIRILELIKKFVKYFISKKILNLVLKRKYKKKLISSSTNIN